MGMCLDGFGKVSVEVRRESFIIHDEDAPTEYPHPEFYISELDNLIAALQEAKKYVEGLRQ